MSAEAIVRAVGRRYDEIRQEPFAMSTAQFRLTPADWDRVLSVSGQENVCRPVNPAEWGYGLTTEPYLFGLPVVVDPDARPLEV